jgi:hypothetical protein
MKLALLSTILLASLSGAGASVAVAQAPQSPASKVTASETDLRRVNAAEVEAFLHNDPNTLEQLWSNDFVVTNPLNKFVTKQQVLGMVRAGVLVITFYDRQIEYLKFYGDTAIAAGNETVVWGGKMPNAGKTEHLRFTGIWMKQQGLWQQVARHANIVPQ